MVDGVFVLRPCRDFRVDFDIAQGSQNFGVNYNLAAEATEQIQRFYKENPSLVPQESDQILAGLHEAKNQLEALNPDTDEDQRPLSFTLGA